VRGRSGPDEGLPEVGAYLRVSGPSGPLTSMYERRTVVSSRFYFLSGPELSTSESWGPLWGSDSVVDNCTQNTLMAG